jgi:S1-C subfamily serine protease
MRSPGVLSEFSKISSVTSQSVVEILTYKNDEEINRQKSRRLALGIVINHDGYIVTKRSELTTNAWCRSNGTNYNFRIAASDNSYDLALLKVEQGKSFNTPPITWPSPQKLKLAQWIISPGIHKRPMAIGIVGVLPQRIHKEARYNPQQKPWLPQINRRRDMFPAAFTHDSAISMHSCGGPVITTSGDLAGINVARADRTTVYAIPVDVLKSLTDKMLKSCPLHKSSHKAAL